MNRLTKAIKTVSQLGLKQTSLFAIYKFGLKTGHYRRTLAKLSQVPEDLLFEPLLPLPNKEEILLLLGKAGLATLLTEANRIVDENVYMQFGLVETVIKLIPPVDHSLQDWSSYETGKAKVNVEDIKFVWEPARFGWAVTLARAYYLTGDGKYARKFWQLFQDFQQNNPYCKGPNWQSGQEVAVRLATVLMCAPVFFQNDENADQHQKRLAKFIVEHATRIPPTLVYARAQHNNHLITEALGLLCAGYAVPDHSNADRWKKLGKRYLVDAFRKQITAKGEYIQYSNNYHRVMLQSAVLATAVLRKNKDDWPENVKKKLFDATRWLAEEVDEFSGYVANYGHNDGAYLFPFANGGYLDYRPVLQAGGAMFMNQSIFESGPWDEMGLWFNIGDDGLGQFSTECDEKIGNSNIWARMRGHFYQSRPGHADQNHLDLWWQGEPVALDAGTYRYNAEPPWDNQLMTTAVHNTVLIDGRDQMARASRFLWLDWSSGKVSKENGNKLVGYQNGYDRQGVMHKRTLEKIDPLHWVIEDDLVPQLITDKTQHEIQLHWLLPDWDFDLNDTGLVFWKGNRSFYLQVTCDVTEAMIVQVCREGVVIRGEGDCLPQMGWYSPTYSLKEPALSCIFKCKSIVPVRITSDWTFMEQ